MRYLLRVIVGLVFLASAVMKLISIDSFEIYIFSFEWLGLSLSYLAARAIIAAEFTLGIWLLANPKSRFPYMATMLMLIGFTGFLTYLALIGNKESCHCFGSFVSLDPVQSLIKNGVLLALLLVSRRCPPFFKRGQWAFMGATCVAAVATVLIVSPPDNWRYASYSQYTTLNPEALQEAMQNGLLDPEIGEGQKIVCFYSLSCEFCKMSAQKITALRHTNDLWTAPIMVVFGGDPQTPDAFFEQTHLEYQRYQFIPATDFVRITNGTMPLILLMQDGQVIQKFSYRDLH